jgi:hypothetical protein
MNLERQLRKANAVLARFTPTPLDPTKPQSAPSTPYLQWCFSEPDRYDHICPPLWFISWDSDLDGNPVYDYHCACGINRTVHTPDCQSFVIPKIRMTKVKSAPLLESCWVLCRWIPPPPESDWMEIYHSLENYPRQGRYIPVSTGGRVMTLPEANPPLPEASECVIRMFREWDERRKVFREEAESRQMLKDWTPPRRSDGTPDLNLAKEAPANSKFANTAYALKSAMTQFGQLPGKKSHVSWGGLDSAPTSTPSSTPSTSSEGE